MYTNNRRIFQSRTCIAPVCFVLFLIMWVLLEFTPMSKHSSCQKCWPSNRPQKNVISFIVPMHFNYLGFCRVGTSCKNTRRCSFFLQFICIRFLLRTKRSEHYSCILHCMGLTEHIPNEQAGKSFHCIWNSKPRELDWTQ